MRVGVNPLIRRDPRGCHRSTRARVRPWRAGHRVARQTPRPGRSV